MTRDSLVHCLPSLGRVTTHSWLITLVALIATTIESGICCYAAADEPLATIAVISNPYITTLPPEQIKDENDRLRDFLAKTAPASMKRAVTLVNQIKPDALVVLGSLTWSGSDEDLTAFTAFLDQFEVPTFVVPGHRDKLTGSKTSAA